MTKITPINQAEAIFSPLFDANITNLSEFRLQEMGRSDGKITQAFDSAVFTTFANNFTINWSGEIEFSEYDCLRFFITVPPSVEVSARALLNGKEIELFSGIKGGTAPIEPTSAPFCIPGELIKITSINLDFTVNNPTGDSVSITFSWAGLLNSTKEHLIEQALPKYDKNSWSAYMNPQGKAGTKYNVFFNDDAIEKIVKKAQNPLFSGSLANLESFANQMQNFIPENEIREFVPCEPHFFRYVRVRDRNRRCLENDISTMAIAGYIFNRPEWTELAARMIMSIVHTPNWFEGPICCFEGSTFHHVCFMEDHYLSDIVIAMGFMGDVFNDKGLNLIANAIEKAWQVVNQKCEEPGYRWYMNQGLVGNRGRIIGAAFLEMLGRSEYKLYVEKAYTDHKTIVYNYVNEEGHITEGPHYFQYAFGSSISLWLVYAKYKQLPLADIIPERFEKTLYYIDLVLSTANKTGSMIPINQGEPEHIGTTLLSFLYDTYKWDKALQFIKVRIDNKDLKASRSFGLEFLTMALQFPLTAEGENLKILADNNLKSMPNSGLAAYEWENGKILFLCERNPLFGHYHFDRGSFVLEYGNSIIFPDLGTTDYSNPVSRLMRDADYHNLAKPQGIDMIVSNPLAAKAAAEAAIGCKSNLDAEAIKMPYSGITKLNEKSNGLEATLDLSFLYPNSVITALRNFDLFLSNESTILKLEDIWEFENEEILIVNFNSYSRWNISSGSATTSVNGHDIRMEFNERNSVEFELVQTEHMVDGIGNQIFSLKVKLEKSRKTYLSTVIQITT